MDPNATLRNLVDMTVAGNFNGAKDALQILQNWSQSGGFPPANPYEGRDQNTIAIQVTYSGLEARITLPTAADRTKSAYYSVYGHNAPSVRMIVLTITEALRTEHPNHSFVVGIEYGHPGYAREVQSHLNGVARRLLTWEQGTDPISVTLYARCEVPE